MKIVSTALLITGVATTPSIAGVTLTVERKATPACAQLDADFVGNEKSLAIMDHKKGQMIKIQVEFAAAGGDNAPDRAALATWRMEREAFNHHSIAIGNKIAARMTAQGCVPPDHVTSASTYQGSGN